MHKIEHQLTSKMTSTKNVSLTSENVILKHDKNLQNLIYTDGILYRVLMTLTDDDADKYEEIIKHIEYCRELLVLSNFKKYRFLNSDCENHIRVYENKINVDKHLINNLRRFGIEFVGSLNKIKSIKFATTKDRMPTWLYFMIKNEMK